MKSRGVLLILLSAFGYGIMPVFTRIAFNNNGNMYEILFIRFSIAIVLFFLYLCISGRIKMLLLSRKIMYRLMLLGGILFGFTSITLYGAVYYLTPSMSEILYFTYPGVVMLLSIILYKEKITKRKIQGLLILLIGVGLIINMKGIRINAMGVILALSCSLIYSLYIIYIKDKEIQGVDSLIVSFYVMIYANVTYIIFGLINHGFRFKLTPEGYGAIVAIAIFSTLMALIAFTLGSKYLKSSEIAVVAAFEPVVTVIADALILGQRIDVKMFLGIILILSSIIMLSVKVNEISSESKDDIKK